MIINEVQCSIFIILSSNMEWKTPQYCIFAMDFPQSRNSALKFWHVNINSQATHHALTGTKIRLGERKLLRLRLIE